MTVKLPNVKSRSMTFENKLSITVLEWLIILFGCKIKVKKELKAREAKNSLVSLCSLQGYF